MSHELKTPLNAVIGFSEIIKDELLGPVGTPRYKTYAEDIHASGARLLAIINDVLDASRLQGGAITIDARICDLRDIVDNALGRARIATGDRREIAVLLPANLPLVDPQRLCQALANVLSNALKFTPEDGCVTLRAEHERGGGLTLTVADTGIGMASEKIEAALEPVRQLDGSLARRFEGAGLGLSIAKSLLELHGGTLSIDSAVGEGTVVTFALPQARMRSPILQAMA
jgi:signal transduction histidine kinase